MAHDLSDALGTHLDVLEYRRRDVHSTIWELILDIMSDEELRRSPRPALASAVWHAWHVARCEDVAINLLVTNQNQVLDGDNWFERLGVMRRDIGTGMTAEEVAAFNARVDVAAVKGYLRAVKQRTDDVVASLRPEMLVETIGEDDVRRVLATGVVSGDTGWVTPYWTGKTKSWFVWWMASIHTYMHLGQAIVTRDIVQSDGVR